MLGPFRACMLRIGEVKGGGGERGGDINAYNGLDKIK